MPELDDAPPRARALARAAGMAMLAMLAIHVAPTTLGLGSGAAAEAAKTVGTAALLVVLGTRAATARSVGLRAGAPSGRPARRVWLDGLIAMLSVGALGWLLTVGPILADSPDHHLAALVDAAYVVADLLLARSPSPRSAGASA